MENDSDVRHQFAEWLRRQITRRGWLPAALATRMEVAPSTVGRWLRGERLPSRKSIQDIARALDVSADEILEILDLRDAALDEVSPEVRRLQTLIDDAEWNELRFAAVEALLRSYRDQRSDE